MSKQTFSYLSTRTNAFYYPLNFKSKYTVSFYSYIILVIAFSFGDLCIAVLKQMIHDCSFTDLQRNCTQENLNKKSIIWE